MDEPIPGPCDEHGVPLTDAEVAAVMRSRPLLPLITAGHLAVTVGPQGMHVLGIEDGLGSLVVERAVVNAAATTPASASRP